MATEIRVPSLGESISEATVGQWLKQQGDRVAADEPLVELETDKVTVEVPAPTGGVLSEIAVATGTTVAIGSLLGSITEGGAKPSARPAPASATSKPSPIVQPTPAPTTPTTLEREPSPREEVGENDMPPSPAARKLLAESGLPRGSIEGSGRRGQVLKHDVEQAASSMLARERKPKPVPAPRAPVSSSDETREERVRMTRLRQTIAKRLKEAQDSAAMLTTFNDVDMGAVMQLRRDYRDEFEKRHGVKLGMMGFFVKACVEALKEIAVVNAEIAATISSIRITTISVLPSATDAVSSCRCCARSTAWVCRDRNGDRRLWPRAREGNKLRLDDLQGGTFTISNGGVYGSLLSTPVCNAPQIGHSRHARASRIARWSVTVRSSSAR